MKIGRFMTGWLALRVDPSSGSQEVSERVKLPRYDRTQVDASILGSSVKVDAPSGHLPWIVLIIAFVALPPVWALLSMKLGFPTWLAVGVAAAQLIAVWAVVCMGPWAEDGRR